MEEEYINFGDELILKSDFLKAINDAKAYSATQPWSAARRGAFDAVSELAANRGILSTRKYTNPETGESMYYATFGGDPFDINTYDKNTRRGWLDYVNFVGRLAESLPTKKSIDEKKKKEEEERIAKLPTFDNNAFTTLLTGNISKGPLGGKAWDVNLWNTLDDTRDEKGAVGIDNRKTELIKLLRDIDKNFKAEDYNWKDSPFLDADDFKARLAKAIGALESKDLNDDTPALRELGLNYKDWFNNRTGEIYGEDKAGNPVTYGTYYRALLELKDAEAKAATDKAAALLKAQKENQYTNFRFYTGQGTPISLENRKDIKSYINNNVLNGLTPQTQAELIWLFKNHPQSWENLTKEELSKFGSAYSNNPSRLKKISGIKGVYWDSIGNRVIHLTKGVLNNSNNDILNILDLKNPENVAKKLEEELKKLRDQYSLRKEMTAQDWEYLASVVPDIASIVDVEPWTAGGLALTGAGMRHHALSNRPGGMSFTDKLWLGADYLGAGLAAVPGLGDAYLIGRALNTIRKVATPLFAIAGTYGLASSTINAIGKLSRDEDLTTLEKMDIVMSIPALISAYRLRSREGLNEAAKAANQSEVSSNKGKIKVTITDESGNKSTKEINGLSELKAKDLLKLFKLAGNDNSKKAQILKNDSEVLTRANELGIDLNKVSIETDSRKLASYRKPTEIEIYLETNPSSTRARYDAEILNLRNSGKNWQARRLEIYDKFYRGTGGPKGESNGNWLSRAWKWATNTKNLDFAERIKNGETTTPKVETSSTTPKAETSTPKTEKSSNITKENIKAIREDENFKEYKDLINYKKPDPSRLTLKHGSEHTIEFGGKSYNFKYDGEKHSIIINGKSIKVDPEKGMEGVRKKVAEFIRQLRKSDIKIEKLSKEERKELINKLKELKKKGFLKRGGTLTLDETIENFLKNNNI